MTTADEAVILRRAARIVLDRAPERSRVARYIAGFLRRMADAVERMER